MKFFWAHKSETAEHEGVDYSTKTKDELLDSFKSDNWSKLTEENRISLIQEMENRSAFDQGRQPAEIISSSQPSTYGSYNDTTNRIHINVSDFSSYETLDTYVHESNHAYQSYCIENNIGYDEFTRNMMQAEMARDDNGRLYNYANTSPEYDIQCDELDSNNKAARYLLGEQARYQDDPEYRAYIEERKNHFSQVNDSLQNEGERRIALQSNQAYTAYIRGDISEDQYNNINSNLLDSTFVDNEAEDSLKLGAYIEELNSNYAANYTEANIEENNYIGEISDVPAEAYESTYTGEISDDPQGEQNDSYDSDYGM